MPSVWRGAAFRDGSSVVLPQAAPESDPRFAMVADVGALNENWKRSVPDAGLMRTRWVVSGSRLLQNHRAAILESGSPPDAGHATPLCSSGGRLRRHANCTTLICWTGNHHLTSPDGKAQHILDSRQCAFRFVSYVMMGKPDFDLR